MESEARIMAQRQAPVITAPDQARSARSRRIAKHDKAQKLLTEARADIRAAEYESAERKILEAKNLNAKYELFDDKPESVAELLKRYRQPPDRAGTYSELPRLPSGRQDETARTENPEEIPSCAFPTRTWKRTTDREASHPATEWKRKSDRAASGTQPQPAGNRSPIVKLPASNRNRTETERPIAKRPASNRIGNGSKTDRETSDSLTQPRNGTNRAPPRPTPVGMGEPGTF